MALCRCSAGARNLLRAEGKMDGKATQHYRKIAQPLPRKCVQDTQKNIDLLGVRIVGSASVRCYLHVHDQGENPGADPNMFIVYFKII